MTLTRTVDSLVGTYPDIVRKVAMAARRFVQQALPGIEETADATAPVIAYAYGPGYTGMVCTLILSKTGVKLGLVRGVELADPHRLLEGSGKVHRYIQLRETADLERQGVRELVERAHAAWRQRTGSEGNTKRGGRTKLSSGTPARRSRR